MAKRYTESLIPGEFKMFKFMGKIRKYYIIAPSKSQVYNAKRKAGVIIEGSLASQYAKLRDYAAELRRSNPGTTVAIDSELGPENEELFRRIYICLNGCKQGWLAGFRPVISLDACHTKSWHKSQLIFAIGIDADNNYYPIAYAVVEKENYVT